MNAIASRHAWRQLAGPTGDGLNPYLNADGVFIGDGVPLLEKTADGRFQVRAPEVLEVLLRIGYGGPVEMSGPLRSLSHVAKCLNAGDAGQAHVALAITGFAPLASLAHARAMREADELRKNWVDEARDSFGRWVAALLGMHEAPSLKDRTKGLREGRPRPSATGHKPKTPRSALSPPLTAQQQARRQKLIAAQDRVRANPELKPDADGTHCNRAVVDTLKAIGAPTEGLVDRAGNPLLANSMARHLETSSAFREVTPEQAQALANQGDVVIGAAYGAEHGHVVTVRPEGIAGDQIFGRHGPTVNHVGAKISVARQSGAFSPKQHVHYYAQN